MEKFQTKHVNHLFIIQSPMRNSDFILGHNFFLGWVGGRQGWILLLLLLIKRCCVG
jgi:hypothetical protein